MTTKDMRAWKALGMTFRSILCPVDFSPQSRAALRAASLTAERFGGSLTVMFVNDPILLAAAKAAYGERRKFVDRTNAELARFVRQVVGTSRREHDAIPLVVRAGNPAEEILTEAARLRSDLVVMGSHGLSGVQKALFGSTTEQVLRKARLPVLAIPPSMRSRRRATLDVTQVIAPIDLAGAWQSDAIRAGKVAAHFNARLLLVHVVAPVQAPPWSTSTVGSNERRRVDKARTVLERVRTKLFAELESISTLVVIGNAAHEIARLTSGGRSLVVMSLRGTAGIWGVRRGSMAYHVLAHSSTPVLALPRRRIGGRFSVRAKKAIGDALSARDRMEIAGIDALLSLGSGRKSLRR